MPAAHAWKCCKKAPSYGDAPGFYTSQNKCENAGYQVYTNVSSCPSGSTDTSGGNKSCKCTIIPDHHWATGGNPNNVSGGGYVNTNGVNLATLTCEVTFGIPVLASCKSVCYDKFGGDSSQDAAVVAEKVNCQKRALDKGLCHGWVGGVLKADGVVQTYPGSNLWAYTVGGTEVNIDDEFKKHRYCNRGNIGGANYVYVPEYKYSRKCDLEVTRPDGSKVIAETVALTGTDKNCTNKIALNTAKAQQHLNKLRVGVNTLTLIYQHEKNAFDAVKGTFNYTVEPIKPVAADLKATIVK